MLIDHGVGHRDERVDARLFGSAEQSLEIRLGALRLEGGELYLKCACGRFIIFESIGRS